MKSQGKLLGQIDKIELDKGKYNDIWEKQLQSVHAFREDEIDNFFRYWLKAKHADNRKAGQRFDGDYHREMFKTDMNAVLKLDHNPAEVKTFLTDLSAITRALFASGPQQKRFPRQFSGLFQ